MKRAAKSLCAESFDFVLEGKSSTDTAELKEQAFEQMYNAMGAEIVPEDLERALAIRNEKFNPVAVCCLNVITLGLFCFFRPRDDDAVLLLKRQGRVLLLKTERPGFFSGNAPQVLLRIFQYMLVLLLFMSVPVLIGALLSAGPEDDNSDVEVVRLVTNIKLALDKHLMTVLREKSSLVLTAYVLAFVAFCFFLWTKCPHDYGTQHRQSHAAKSIVAGQFVLSGTSYRRRCYLRLYFGRYPEQQVLDRSMTLRSGQVCGPVPRDELVKAGEHLGKRRMFGGASFTSQGGIIAFTVMVSVVTVLDSSLTWLDRYWEVARLAQISQFCRTAAMGTCNPKACSEWAAEKGFEPGFCTGVNWLSSDAGSPSILKSRTEAVCLEYTVEPPCCGGCISGEANLYLDNGLTAFRGILSTLSDIGTLFMTFMAAKWAMGQAAEKHHVDVTMARRPGWQYQTSNLELSTPLAVHFMETVFQKAWEDDLLPEPAQPTRPDRLQPGARAGSGVLESVFGGRSGEKWPASPDKGAGGGRGAAYIATPPPARRDSASLQQDGQGVRNFEEDWTCCDWDEFFGQRSLVEPGLDRWWPRVIVPRRCMGMLQRERIMATWVETPFLTLVHIIPNIMIAAALFMVVYCMPSSEANHTVLIPGLGDDLQARMASATIISLSFLALSILIMWFCLFAALQHVLIVTDLRTFYVRHRRPCWCLCMWGREIRLDVFRHDRDVFHAHMNSMSLSFMQRLARVFWVPGHIFLQVKYGVLQLTRRNGNVLDIQNVVSQLSEKGKSIDKADLEKADVSWDWCQEWVSDSMSRKGSNVWRLTAQPDDLLLQDIDIFLADDERPIFAWSFKEIGPLTSPYTVNTDVIVTTGRIILWSRTIYKSFDCKTSCCFWACWCSCCLGCCNARLPSSLSFLMLPSLLSFGTETIMEPPVWYDPNHLPVKMPCFDECCRALTRCVTCDKDLFRCDLESCDACPTRSGPRAQLWMHWRLRQNMMMSQPDMECSIRPYTVPGVTEVDLASTLGLRQEEVRSGVAAHRDTSRRLEMLRRIMGVAQDASKPPG